MRYLLLFTLFLIPLLSDAQLRQVAAKIVNPGALYSSYDFEEDHGKLKPAIRVSGSSADVTRIITYSNETNWPAAMQQLDSRISNRANIQLYTVYKILHTSDYCILIVPAAENKHMPENMRPSQDIFFIMTLDGAAFEGNIPDAHAVESYDEDEEDEEGSGVTKIVAPGDLYSTFDLNNNASMRAIVVESGILTEEQFQVIVKLAHEKNWPSGISSLEKRIAVAEKMKEYTAYYIMHFGENEEYVLVWIPIDENVHMPVAMRPTDQEGFYFVLKSTAVEIGY
ncbi:MAG: hypothetical protein E6Q37_09070 [Crocinitomicaceae bacterium]|nr:MAG: hypothetical protein E6Q37_09070 [Crocinitomicaceae bacterium]